MMKGLLITETFPPNLGGVETFLENICLHSNNRIDVLTESISSSGENGRKRDYAEYRIELKPALGLIQYLLKGVQLCLKNRYDFIFVGSVSPVLYAATWLKRIFGLPLVLLYHGFDLERQLLASPIKAVRALRHCDLLLTNSNFNYERYLDLFPSAGETKVLNPGVDTGFFSPAIGFRNAMDAPVILSVGRLVEKKNHALVLNALVKVRGRFPNIKYLIAGDGPESESLKDLSKRLGLNGNVLFLGSMRGPKLVQLYNFCDLFILPSKERRMNNNGRIDAETFGIVFLEANACGKPVIGGNSGGIPDAIEDGVTGYLIDPGNEGELAVRIIELLSDKEKAEKMGQAGRERAVAQFDWKKVTNKFDAFLAEVVK